MRCAQFFKVNGNREELISTLFMQSNLEDELYLTMINNHSKYLEDTFQTTIKFKRFEG